VLLSHFKWWVRYRCLSDTVPIGQQFRAPTLDRKWNRNWAPQISRINEYLPVYLPQIRLVLLCLNPDRRLIAAAKAGDLGWKPSHVIVTLRGSHNDIKVTLKLNLTKLRGQLRLSLSPVLQVVPQRRLNMAVLIDYHDIHVRVFDVAANVSLKFR